MYTRAGVYGKCVLHNYSKIKLSSKFVLICLMVIYSLYYTLNGMADFQYFVIKKCCMFSFYRMQWSWHHSFHQMFYPMKPKYVTLLDWKVPKICHFAFWGTPIIMFVLVHPINKLHAPIMLLYLKLVNFMFDCKLCNKRHNQFYDRMLLPFSLILWKQDKFKLLNIDVDCSHTFLNRNFTSYIVIISKHVL